MCSIGTALYLLPKMVDYKKKYRVMHGTYNIFSGLIRFFFPLIAIVSIPKLSVVKFCTEALTYGSLCLNQHWLFTALTN